MTIEALPAGTASPPARARPPALLPVVGFAILVFILLSLAPQLYNDGDTGWHLVAGRLILDTGSVPTTDPFSHSFAGKPWLAHEWLAEVIMAACWGAGGWSALSLLFAGTMAVLVLILGLEIGRWLRPMPTLIALILIVLVLAPFTLARPHVLAWPLLAGWMLVLIRAREVGAAPPLAAALVMLAWANLHASFIFGLALAGGFGLEALFAAKDRRRAFVGWLVFGLVSLAATLGTPFGLDGILFPLQVNGMAAIPSVAEWRPTVLSKEPVFQGVLIGVIFILLYRGVRVPVFRLVIICVTLYLSFQAVRHQALLAIVAGLLLAAPLAATFAPRVATAARDRRLVRSALLAILALFIAGRLAVPMVPPDTASNPARTIAALPPGLRAQPVFNGYGFGGPLIFAGVRPYIDGRVDMYGDAFTFEHDRLMNGDIAGFRRIAARRRITWTILPPGSPLAKALDTEPGWQRLRSDRWAVVHARSRALSPV